MERVGRELYFRIPFKLKSIDMKNLDLRIIRYSDSGYYMVEKAVRYQMSYPLTLQLQKHIKQSVIEVSEGVAKRFHALEREDKAMVKIVHLN